MSVAKNDRRSLFLMLSLLLLILLTPFLEDQRIGEIFLMVSLYLILITAILELHGKETLRWLAIGAAIPVVLVQLATLFRPSHSLLIVAYALLIAFFGFVSVGLFTYLGKPGAITSGRVYASVSLYLLLGMFWFALFNLTETITPGSFAHDGVIMGIPRSSFLYFSLVTLTTLGYGDVLRRSSAARTMATLEAVMGQIYLAVLVARFVGLHIVHASKPRTRDDS